MFFLRLQPPEARAYIPPDCRTAPFASSLPPSFAGREGGGQWCVGPPRGAGGAGAEARFSGRPRAQRGVFNTAAAMSYAALEQRLNAASARAANKAARLSMSLMLPACHCIMRLGLTGNVERRSAAAGSGELRRLPAVRRANARRQRQYGNVLPPCRSRAMRSRHEHRLFTCSGQVVPRRGPRCADIPRLRPRFYAPDESRQPDDTGHRLSGVESRGLMPPAASSECRRRRFPQRHYESRGRLVERGAYRQADRQT